MRLYILPLIALALCWMIAAPAARADQVSAGLKSSPSTARRSVGKLINPFGPRQPIAGESQATDKLITDFLDVAFPRVLLWEDTDRPDNFVRHFPTASTADGKDAVSHPHSWANRWIYLQEGIPRANAITKWTTPITIGFGWPKISNKGPSRPTDYGRIKSHVDALVPTIRHLTGLPVELLDPTDPRENTDAFARLRIVISGSLLGARNYFKSDFYCSDFGCSRQFPETAFSTAVWFTPLSRDQVEGYFIPAADNSIDFAVCKLNSYLDNTMLNALVTECLARALGLPEMSRSNDTAALGHWNKAYDSVSYRSVLDGSDYSRVPTAKSFPTEGMHTYGLENTFSAYDKSIISLLYCPLVKPGMDIYRVIRALKTNPQCFQHIKKDSFHDAPPKKR